MRVENTRVVGKVKEIGSSEAAAWREVARLGLDLLATDRPALRELTFNDLSTHYCKHKLGRTSGVAVKAAETAAVQELNLRRWILPRWGQIALSQIRPLAIEKWFESLATQPIADDNRPLKWPRSGR